MNRLHIGRYYYGGGLGSGISADGLMDRVYHKGENIWVEFIDEKEARRGSIGRISKIKTHEMKRSDYGWTMWAKVIIEFPGLKAAPIKITLESLMEKCVVLKDYEGEAKRENNKVVVDTTPAIVRDKFGVEAKIGDLVVFSRYGGIEFATITSISPNASVGITLFDSRTETRMGDIGQFAVLHNEFRNQMMLRRLTAK